MSNFRLNLPIDIPWKLVNCSEDMMDKTFCDKRMPSPFRSSIALYTYNPKKEDIPEEYSNCGKQITYLKVSCSITGYQPSQEEKQQIVDLLAPIKGIDYSKIEDIKQEYFGCYGVLLNVSVHPDKKNKDDLTKYPHIIDFEPKVRDFYQAASETGELMTSSISKVSTNKSFGTTDQTQSSWSGGANTKATIPVEGIPVELGLNGSTGQVRTETDQENWGVTTDASRERKETQSVATQLSQMYNLLTGYHSGTNRASFVMLPRPHILQPTDRRTFVQGLRIIEGVQDFFLIVLRDNDQPVLNVDAFLQTGHFPENIPVGETVAKEDQFEFTTKEVDSFSIKCLGLSLAENAVGSVLDGLGGDAPGKRTDVTNGLITYDGFETDGWEFDPDEGDSGHKSIEEIKDNSDTLDDFEGISFIKHTYKTVVPDTVQLEVVVKNRNGWPTDGASKAKFDRKYKVFLRRKKDISVSAIANVNGLLITQRKLCTQITYTDCISSKDVTVIKNKPIDSDLVDVPGKRFDDIVSELPFNIAPLYNIPRLTNDKSPEQRNDFAFKKGILRMIQHSMLSGLSEPTTHEPGGIGYLQTKHFQKKLLQVLPNEILESPIHQLDFVNSKVKEKFSKSVTIKEIVLMNDVELRNKYDIGRNEIFKSPSPAKTK